MLSVFTKLLIAISMSPLLVSAGLSNSCPSAIAGTVSGTEVSEKGAFFEVTLAVSENVPFCPTFRLHRLPILPRQNARETTGGGRCLLRSMVN